MGFLLSLQFWKGAAFSFAIVMAWAVLVHGPGQYRSGGAAALAKADKATSEAAKGLANEADKRRVMLIQCAGTGGMFNFADGKCIR
jgi:hypothetical protein